MRTACPGKEDSLHRMVPPPRGNQNTMGDLGYLPDGHVRHSSELQAPPLLFPHPGPPGNGSGCPVNQLDRGLKPKSDMFHPNPQIYRLHARRLLDKLALLKPSVTSWPTLPGINQPSRTSPPTVELTSGDADKASLQTHAHSQPQIHYLEDSPHPCSGHWQML